MSDIIGPIAAILLVAAVAKIFTSDDRPPQPAKPKELSPREKRALEAKERELAKRRQQEALRVQASLEQAEEEGKDVC